jgi:predicted  nucleic acid-binding Zn-ribbon protein
VKVKSDREAVVKTLKTVQDSLNAKDQRITTLAKDNEAALTELATLRQEKAEWASENEGLEEAIGDQYEECFKFALDQVKVLFLILIGTFWEKLMLC